MKTLNEVIKQNCAICGCGLTEENTTQLPRSIAKRSHPICTSCQQKWYDFLSRTAGASTAIYLCCSAFNVAYSGAALKNINFDDDGTTDKWIAYLKNVRERTTPKNHYERGFAAGEIKSAKGYAYSERKDTWEEKWGYGPDAEPYKQADYEYLEQAYSALTDKRQVRDEQAEFSIRKICTMELDFKRCMDAKLYAEADKIAKMLKIEKENEKLRKKDELPQDNIRIDDLVTACEKKGIPLYDFDELAKVLANYALHPPYAGCRDIADQIILLIRNATAWNEGKPEVPRLEETYAAIDTMGEFEDEAIKPDTAKLYKELQITPLDMPDKGVLTRRTRKEKTPFPPAEDED